MQSLLKDTQAAQALQKEIRYFYTCNILIYQNANSMEMLFCSDPDYKHMLAGKFP